MNFAQLNSAALFLYRKISFFVPVTLFSKKEPTKPSLHFFFQILKIPEHKSDLLTVEGHTDNVPMRSKKFPSNWELSSARATMIAGMLINRIKYPENSISIVGYADTRPKTGYTNAVGVPLVGSALKKARKINRRVEIVLTTPPKSIEQATLLFGEEN